MLAVALTVAAGARGAAVFEAREFRSPAEEARYKQLIDELRCLVCQNQNIADSDADLARDLRDRVHRMVNDGKSEREIVDFMVARYGDFVLYRPPFKATTVALWVGPFVLGIAALVVLIRRLRSDLAGRESAPVALGEEESARARALLDTGHDDQPPR